MTVAAVCMDCVSSVDTIKVQVYTKKTTRASNDSLHFIRNINKNRIIICRNVVTGHVLIKIYADLRETGDIRTLVYY